MDTATKTGLGAAKIVSKKVAHKKTEATGELIRNKIAKKWNQKPCSGNQTSAWYDFKKCWKNGYSSREKTNINRIKTIIIKLQTTKYLNY